MTTLPPLNITSTVSRPRHILLVANTCWYLYNFRLPLLQELRNHGYKVALVAPHDSYTELLESSGFHVHNWLVKRSSVNPLNEAVALLDLYRIYERERPDLVHHFTIKACLYGTIAAKTAHIYRVINAITGLGHVFLSSRPRGRLFRFFLRPFYTAIFRARRSTVVFQNSDDQEHLIGLGITDSDRSSLIRGSGVDIHHFQPIIDNSGVFHNPPRILFPSRLIFEKGISELLQACRTLWSQGVSFHLNIAGDVDQGNRSSLGSIELSAIKSDQRISLLGHVSNMRQVLSDNDIIVLPSWREGLSRALIEAASMERPIITTDVPGCRDVVDHGRSGLLVPSRDPSALSLALLLFLRHPELARACGKQARRKVTAEFQVTLVNQRTLEQYKLLFDQPVKRRSPSQ